MSRVAVGLGRGVGVRWGEVSTTWTGVCVGVAGGMGEGGGVGAAQPSRKSSNIVIGRQFNAAGQTCQTGGYAVSVCFKRWSLGFTQNKLVGAGKKLAVGEKSGDQSTKGDRANKHVHYNNL